MQQDKLQKIKGQMIVESMIAISVAVVGLFGVMTLLSRSISLNRVIANHYIGNSLAAEGIEIIKYFIDKNYLAGVGWNADLGEGAYLIATRSDKEIQEGPFFSRIGGLGTCNDMEKINALDFNKETGVYNYDNNDDTLFKRCVEIRHIEIGDRVDALGIVSKVSWEDLGGAEFEVVVEDHFYNWR